MRRLSTVALAVLVLLLPVAGLAAAEEPGLYASVSGAIVMPRDSSYKVSETGARGKYGFKTGGGFTLAGGYALGNGLRAELELGYRSVKIDELTIYPYSDGEETVEGTKVKVKATVKTLSLMANALYAFHEAGLPVLPYAGAGIGWAQHKSEGDSAGAFAYQFMLGIKYPVDRLELGIGYRLLGTTDADFDGVKVDYLSHNFELGVTFRF